MGIAFGCVGDDFTGSADAASFLAREGLPTILYSGIPKEDAPVPAEDAAVIALKIRTIETDKAVLEALAAFDWLKGKGAGRLYYKYCSTFDSTPRGNIGPVVDAVLQRYGIPYTILCPALPVNGRTVKDGRLLVDGVPLHQTHMKDHPLTPMWDSDIQRLMAPQGRYACMAVNGRQLQLGDREIMARIGAFGRGREHFYVIPDCYEESHAQRIAGLFGGLPFLTGGSGLMAPLARLIRKNGACGPDGRFSSKTRGKALILAGSCSEATLAQIEDFKRRGGYHVRLDPAALLRGAQSAQRILERICAADVGAVLVYSSDVPERVRAAQKEGAQAVSAALEGAMAQLAQSAVENGFGRVIVAGGETSGAVTQALGLDAYRVGDSIAPGVPVLMPVKRPALRLVLKSGNFGQRDFFRRAVACTGG